jgi:hypothetical protein
LFHIFLSHYTSTKLELHKPDTGAETGTEKKENKKKVWVPQQHLLRVTHINSCVTVIPVFSHYIPDVKTLYAHYIILKAICLCK